MAQTNANTGWKLKKITATGQALAAGDVFGGVMHPTTGTTTTLTAYDDTSAVAGNLIIATTATLTAGQFVGCTGGVVTITASRDLSDGIQMARGLWLVVGGTGSPVFWVLYK